MASNENDLIRELVHRLFIGQVILVAVSAILVGVAIFIDVGFFWFAFLAGMFGASVAYLRRARKNEIELAKELLRSRTTTLAPFLYGGIMAAVTYFLFLSGILSGKEGDGFWPQTCSPTSSRLRQTAGNWPLRIS